jgi:hypothetical protein
MGMPRCGGGVKKCLINLDGETCWKTSTWNNKNEMEGLKVT